jgi:hypothetical protein
MNCSFREKQNDIEIPHWMPWTQIALFAILYAVWALPETILIRHICLIGGALIGAYEVYQYRAVLLTKYALPVWLIIGLLIWASFHLIVLSSNFILQFEEYSSIWKRTTLGAVFALGLGLTLGGQDTQKQKAYWDVFYFGLLTPTLIYILKYGLTHYGERWGIHAPDFLKLHYGSLPFYLPKTAYVCFCLPALAVALGQLKRNIGRYVWFSWDNVLYGLTIPLVFFVFYGENIKNGVIYGAFLMTFFALQVFLVDFKRHWIKKTLLAAMFLVAGVGFLANHIQKNESWQTFAVDAQIAIDTDHYDHWKYNGAKGYPNNALGKRVSITNYERIAWGKEGLILLTQNPLGYGLIERSFGHLAKEKWPDSTLHQSHSGWLDLALGIGIPGILLVLGPLLLTMGLISARLSGGRDSNSSQIPQSTWMPACSWILLASLVMWCTTEISQKVFFDSLIFWIALGAGVVASLGMDVGGKH